MQLAVVVHTQALRLWLDVLHSLAQSIQLALTLEPIHIRDEALGLCWLGLNGVLKNMRVKLDKFMRASWLGLP